MGKNLKRKNLKTKKGPTENNFMFIFLVTLTPVLFSLLALTYKVNNDNLSKNQFLEKEKNGTIQDCPVTVEEKIVRGSSMEPVLKEGQKIKILYGYYKCYPILREDIIVYDFKGDEYPLVKRVKGIEGDDFHLERSQGGWLILINGEIVKNSNGEPYIISEKGYRMLSLYERDYQGKIPAGAYLILGENSRGSVDSTFFGLVGKEDILGKVEF